MPLSLVFFLLLHSISGKAKPSVTKTLKEANENKQEISEPHSLSKKNFSKEELFEQALTFLKQGETLKATPLLQKSFYQYFSFHSYQILKDLKQKPSLKPHLSLFLLFFFLGFYLLFLIRHLKKPSFSFYGFFFFINILTLLTIHSFLSLRMRVSALETLKGKQTPFEESEVLWQANQGEDFLLVTKKKDWWQIKNKKKEKAWVRSQKLFVILN